MGGIAVSDVEIISIELLGEAQPGVWSWRGRFGVPHHGCGQLDRRPVSGLRSGDTLTVRVSQQRMTWVDIEVLSLAPAIPRASLPDHDEWVPGPSFRRISKECPLREGDIVLQTVRFSKPDGSGRTSKPRPCVVVLVGSDAATLRAVYGTNTAVRRNGSGRRILDWKSAGLRKPSVVARLDLTVALATIQARIGHLSEADKRRLIGG